MSFQVSDCRRDLRIITVIASRAKTGNMMPENLNFDNVFRLTVRESKSRLESASGGRPPGSLMISKLRHLI